VADTTKTAATTKITKLLRRLGQSRKKPMVVSPLLPLLSWSSYEIGAQEIFAIIY
jgi:hypothetical protein